MNLVPYGIAVRGRPKNIRVFFGLSTTNTEWTDITTIKEMDGQVYQMRIGYRGKKVGVKLACELQGKVCGIAGNFDGILGNDLVLANGTSPFRELNVIDKKVQDRMIGDSWEVSTLVCSIQDSEELQECDAETIAAAVIECEDAYEFLADYNNNTCNFEPKKPKTFEACVYDLCQYETELWEETLCDTMAKVTDDCENEGNNLEDWRDAQPICYPVCPNNMHYSTCQEYMCKTKWNCQEDEDCPIEDVQCTEGCACNVGYFWDGTRCLSKDKCPKEAPSNVIEEELSCYLQEAKAYGDVHYATFDSDRLDFQGNCWYMASTVCDADVSDDLEDYEFHVKGEEQFGMQKVSWAVAARLSVRNVTIKFHKDNPKLLIENEDGEVAVLDSRANIRDLGLVLRKYDSFSFVIYAGVPDSYFENYSGDYTDEPEGYHIRWTPSKFYENKFQVACKYSGKMCGLLGNGDGDSSYANEFVSSNGTVVDDLDDFGHSWRIESIENAVCFRPDSPSGCEEDQPELHAIVQDQCSLYVQAPFLDTCGSQISDQYYVSCLYDFCYTNETNWREIGCMMALTMAKECAGVGYDVTNWIEGSVCENAIECHTNAEYMTNVMGCQVPTTQNCNEEISNYCSDSTPLEGCFCSEGYFWDEMSASCVSTCPPVPVEVPVCEPGVRVKAAAFGDPHFETFDGQVMHYNGKCEHLLTGTQCAEENGESLDGQKPFNVYVFLDNHHENPVQGLTYIYGYRIVYDNYLEIEFGYNWPQPRVRAINDKNSKSIPVEYGQYLRFNSDFVRFEGNTVDLRITLGSGNDTINININSRTHRIEAECGCYYKNKLCGLLGNYDDVLNDFLHKTGTDPYLLGEAGFQNIDEKERTAKWGTTFKTDNEVNEFCENPYVELASCDNITTVTDRCKTEIEYLTENYNTTDCEYNSLKSQESCVFDLCHRNETDWDLVLCDIMNSVANQCHEFGDWRSDDKFSACVIPCSNIIPNSEYSACPGLNNCATTESCETEQVCEVETCRPGCECSQGYYFNGIDCVELNFCELDQVSPEFNLVCYLEPAVHHRESKQVFTFDGKRVEFDSDCEYILSTTKCSESTLPESLLPYTLSTGYKFDNTSYNFNRMTIHRETGDFHLTYYPGRSQYFYSVANGQDVKFLENSQLSNFILRKSDEIFIGENLLQHVIKLNLKDLTLEIDCQYSEQVCGIFGNADNDDSNDLDSPLGYDLNNSQLLVNSWTVDAKTCTTETEPEVPVEEPATCDENAMFFANQICRSYFNLLTPQCDETHDNLLEACNREVCRMEESSDFSDIGCRYAVLYLAKCNDLNYHISEPWRGDQCPITCGMNQEYKSGVKKCDEQTIYNCNSINATSVCNDHTLTEGCFCASPTVYSPIEERCVSSCPETEPVTPIAPVEPECTNDMKFMADGHYYSFDTNHLVTEELPMFKGCGDYVLLTTTCYSGSLGDLKEITVTGSIRPDANNTGTYLKSFVIEQTNYNDQNGIIRIIFNPAKSKELHFTASGVSGVHQLSELAIAYYLTPYGISVDNTGIHFDKFSVTYQWYADDSEGLEIELNCDYSGLVCGAISGDFDGIHDEPLMESELSAYETSLMESWAKYPSECPEDLIPEPPQFPEDCESKGVYTDAQDLCQEAFDHYEFCTSDEFGFQKTTCEKMLCNSGRALWDELFCTFANSLDKECIDLGFGNNFEPISQCIPECSENESFANCASLCPINSLNCHLDSTCDRCAGRGCECLPGYFRNEYGMCIEVSKCGQDSCEKPLICGSDVQGSCVSNSTGGYSCSCNEDYYGSNCQFTVPCFEGPCGPYGECANTVTDNEYSGYNCTCDEGYTGTLCTTKIPCSDTPCKNSGTCSNSFDYSSFNCECSEFYTGETCETLIPCSVGPCMNNATCVNSEDYATYSAFKNS